MDFLSLVENLKIPQFLAPCILPQGIHIFASHSKKGQKLDWCPLRSEPPTIGSVQFSSVAQSCLFVTP